MKMKRKIRRLLLLAAGWTCVGLGAVGVATPLLPTTPFLLLAAFCFAGSSPRLYKWLVRLPWVKTYLDNYRSGCGVPVRTKALSLLALWLTLGISSLFKENIYYKLILLAVGLGVSTHILLLKTARPAREK